MAVELDDNVQENLGCTIPDAVNYDLAAKEDNGSCNVTIVAGMTFFTQFLSNVDELAALQHQQGGVLHIGVSDFDAEPALVTKHANLS